jgi:prepilin-type N-terminal cleavage/methylation domain-containing protein
MKTAQKGFTLVEIAIVLVIIGLLLGGILKGQEMIVQARIKNVIADMTGVSAAMYGYQDRYRAVPGDDRNANPRWAAATAGDGNGIVGGTYNANCTAAPPLPESCLFWQHLRLAGFVAGTGAGQPFNAVQGMLGVQTGDGAATPAPALTSAAPPAPGFVSLVVCSANLPEKIAIAADTQMDDGDSRTGTVRAQRHTAGPNPAINAAADGANFEETGSNVYTICRTL